MKLYEYSEAANPMMTPIKPTMHKFGGQFGMELVKTTPSLKAIFVTIPTGYIRIPRSNATSHLFRVVRGESTIECEQGKFTMNVGDVLSLPYMKEGVKITGKRCTLFWINDEPLMSYLGVEPTEAKFKGVHYSAEVLEKFVRETMEGEKAEKKNRNGVLLSNEEMEEIGTKTLTPTLWALLNLLPAHKSHKPHRHNSVALDLCVSAKDDNVYTLMGKELNEDGSIKEPIKMMWKKDTVFVTPPGWWHSHHNESDEEAWVFPVQDAGLHTYMRTLDIEFS